MLRLLVFLWFAVVSIVAIAGTSDCPVCERVIKAAKELGVKQGITPSIALDKYCNIPANNVEDEKFCYNVGTAKKDINRLLDLGANEERICKKVKAINSHFCTAKTVKTERTGVQVNERLKRGVIYE